MSDKHGSGFGASIMRDALAKFSHQNKGSELGDRTAEVLARSERTQSRHQVVKGYYKRLRNSLRDGYKGHFAYSDLDQPPGTPVKLDDRTGRIKWFLVKGDSKLAVIIFDQPIDVLGIPKAVTLGIVPVERLQPCDCRGYTHTRGCN